MKLILYILSITLQVTGSILLMIYLLSTNRKEIIKKFANSNSVIKEDGNTGTIDYNHDAFKDEFKNAYLNKEAFCCIAIGTLMSIFAEKGNVNEWVVCFFIIILVIGIIIFLLPSLIKMIFDMADSIIDPTPSDFSNCVNCITDPNSCVIQESDD